MLNHDMSSAAATSVICQLAGKGGAIWDSWLLSPKRATELVRISAFLVRLDRSVGARTGRAEISAWH